MTPTLVTPLTTNHNNKSLSGRNLMGIAQRELVYIGGACVAGAVGFVYGVKWIQRRVKNYYHPFERIGVVSELYIYPVTSCRGRQVQWMDCAEAGGYNGQIKDRHFVIVNAKTKQILTARTCPRAVLIDCDVRDNILTLTTAEYTSIQIDLEKVLLEKDYLQVGLYDNLKQTGLDCGSAVGGWLAKVLDVAQPLQLVYFQHGAYTERACQQNSRWFFGLNPTPNEQLLFTDLAAYTAFSNESMSELTSHYDEDSEQQITSRQFRPSIVVDKCPAHDEDLWMELRIGDAEFDCYKYCARGVMTTVDPETGEKDSEAEPLKTLCQYRLAPEGELRTQYKSYPIFGVNMELLKSGTIHVGDEVYARYKDQPF